MLRVGAAEQQGLEETVSASLMQRTGLTEGKLWLWALGLLLKVKAWLPVRGFPLLLSVVLVCGELGRDVRGEMLCLAINSRVAKGFL